MRRNGSRVIKVNKQNLIDKIYENKKNHINEYETAVKAYKIEVLKQLADLTERANNGEMNLKLNITTPVDNRSEYDKRAQMFEWEVDDVVELEQSEFLEYVQDETNFAMSAKISNTMYLSNL